LKKHKRSQGWKKERGREISNYKPEKTEKMSSPWLLQHYFLRNQVQRNQDFQEKDQQQIRNQLNHLMARVRDLMIKVNQHLKDTASGNTKRVAAVMKMKKRNKRWIKRRNLWMK